MSLLGYDTSGASHIPLTRRSSSWSDGSSLSCQTLVAAPADGNNKNMCTVSASENVGTSAPVIDSMNTLTFQQVLALEISKYECQEGVLTYKPGPLDDRQLRQAALEFQKRWEKEESRLEKEEESLEADDCPFVLVSRNCSKIPSDGLTRHALQRLEIGMLWYYLTEDGDLFITKMSSGPCHGACVSAVIGYLFIFALQYADEPFTVLTDGELVVVGGRKAPDAVLLRRYPLQQASVVLRSPFVVEVEVGNRGPKALMLQLEQYLQLPHSAYVLGIKIYKKRRHLPNHPFAAVAILWHRPPLPVGGGPPPGINLVNVWNFGTADLHSSSKRAFCGLGPGVLAVGLPLPVMGNFQYPAPNTIINVPSATLVTNQNVLDSNGVLIPDGPDLTIDLAWVVRAAGI
jgi:hypothetical protein